MNLAKLGSIAGRFASWVATICVGAHVCAQAPVAPDATPQTPASQSAPAAPQAPSTKPLDWKTYSYPADGFSASFPSQPAEQKQSVQTDAGSFELRTYLAASASTALYIGVCDYGEAARGSDPDEVLEGAQKGAVSNVNAHLIHSKKVTLGTYPGVAFEAETQGSHFFGRIYLVGTILYQVFVAPAPGEAFPETTRFLDSFQLIARAEP